MNFLNGITQELQHIIDAIYAVTDIDVTIVDKDLNRVAATKNINKLFRKQAPENSVFHKSLLTGKQYLISNTKNDPLCIQCYNRDTCTELAELCIPIHFNKEIIGVLGMCAFNEKAKNNLLNNVDSYIKFENQLSSIISTIISEKRFGELLEYRSKELVTLINSLNEGIVILNKNLDIITKNKYINEKFGLKEDTPYKIAEVVGDKVMAKLVEISYNGETEPVKIRGADYVVKSSLIGSENGDQGIILVFSDFEKMKESVIKSGINRHLITFDDIIGDSELLLRAKRQAIQVADSEASVLLTGETGTGKEIFARAIHASSKRSKEVFIAINCGAIPDNLIESELFGYESGSFTGATATGKPGKFEMAKEGTLFLDEIGDLPYSMQVKILRRLKKRK